MEPDRFGDVSFRFLDDPDGDPEPPPRRRRRWTLALPAAVIAAGCLAAGANALTGSSERTVRPARVTHTHGVRTEHSGPICHGHRLGRHAPSTAPAY